ncbi:MAG: thiamine phosphate synthase [Archangium sp.]|nr:thiamine phosphate synthase [Archangium sp.]
MIPFKLLLITDWSRPGCIEIVKSALTAGPGIAVQHRHPGATDRQFYEEGLRLRDACADAPLFINGRLDVALALDAHLHLTERSLLPSDVRTLLGSRWLSSACHPGTARPPTDHCDLLLVSPVFDPISKPPERPALGADAFRAFVASTPVPCFALGGITAARIPQLKPLAGVAVIGEVMHAESPAHAAEALLRALE